MTSCGVVNCSRPVTAVFDDDDDDAVWCRWSETPVERRCELLMRLADLLEGRLDEFAEAESRDQGKPVWLAKSVDIPRAVYNFRCFATAAPHQLDTCVVLTGKVHEISLA